MAKIIWKGCPTALPVEIDYTPVDTSDQVFYLAGSAFTRGEVINSRIIGFRATVNGEEIVRTEIYSNAEGVHRATVPGMNEFQIPLELKMHDVDGNSVPVIDEDGNLHAKVVTITIEKLNDSTITDGNDTLVFALM